MQERVPRQRGGMLQMVARLLLVPGVIIAIAIMLKGYADIGDGFSAGVIAALIVITQGLAFGADELEKIPAARLAPFAGFVGLAVAYSLAFVPLMVGYDLFTHFPMMNEPAIHFGVLEIITPVLFDVAVFLVVYGFCVGAMMAVARAEGRHQRLVRRARKQAGTREGESA